MFRRLVLVAAILSTASALSVSEKHDLAAQYVNARRQKDTNTLLSLISDDVLLVKFPYGEVHGKAAYKKYLQRSNLNAGYWIDPFIKGEKVHTLVYTQSHRFRIDFGFEHDADHICRLIVNLMAPEEVFDPSMSENLKLANDYSTARENGNIEQVLSLLADDVEFMSFPYGLISGKEAFRKYLVKSDNFMTSTAVWSTPAWDPEEGVISATVETMSGDFIVTFRFSKDHLINRLTLELAEGNEFFTPFKSSNASRKLQERYNGTLPKVVILRLDYFYPTRVGDVASPESFSFDVTYQHVEGLSFECCQNGLDENGLLSPSEIDKEKVDLWNAKYYQERKYPYYIQENAIGRSYIRYTTETIEQSLREVIEQLLKPDPITPHEVVGITADCGFFMHLQDKIDDIAYDISQAYRMPPTNIMMSSLLQLSFIQQSIGKRRKVAIVTANAKSFMKDYAKLLPWGARKENIVVVGMEDVDGFGDEVANGDAIKPIAGENIIKKLRQVIDQDPSINGILMECTELPFISNQVRDEFNMIVVDALSMLNYLYTAHEGFFLQ